MGGYDPYSSSKAACELVVSAYKDSFFGDHSNKKPGIATVRAGNVIGGGDWSMDRIIPDCIRSLEDNMPIPVRNPNSTRPWQHVLEPLSGYLLLASKMLCGETGYSDAWNFGPNSESIVHVGTVVDTLIKHWGSGCWDNVGNKSKTTPHESTLLSLDCTKAKMLLDWNPRLSLDEAIKLTTDWYKLYQSADVYQTCVTQIKSYCTKLERGKTND